jgi:endonuclease/exonuclease/phosphatase family metal-dependent hydrolase
VFRVLLPLLTLAVFAFPPAAPAADASVTLRVMSYNIHHGVGIDGKLDLERIARLITEAKVDLVGLQEVDRGIPRSGKRDLAAELAQLTGMQAIFERNIVYQGGDYGNAILSRFPIRCSRNTHYQMLRAGEQRGLLQAVVEVGGRELLFLNTHIDFRPDDSERLLNVDEMRQVIEREKLPVILLGDFNSVPGSSTHTKLKSFLVDAWEVAGRGDGFTIPVKKPSKRIDFIFVSGATIEPVKMEVIHSIASDHLPIVAELRLK